MAHRIIGIVLVLVLLACFVVSALDAADLARRGGSAVQSTDLTMTGLFYVVLAIGLAYGVSLLAGPRR
jgi:hypothetical protein